MANLSWALAAVWAASSSEPVTGFGVLMFTSAIACAFSLSAKTSRRSKQIASYVASPYRAETRNQLIKFDFHSSCSIPQRI